jgi:CDC6, C terminal winged helix domain
VVILDGICNVFDEIGQEKESTAEEIFVEVQNICHSQGLDRMNQKEFMQSLEQLQFYSLIQIEKKVSFYSQSLVTK